MMSLSIQATWLRGDIRSKLSGISKAKFKFIELTENDLIDAKEHGEDLKALLFEYGLRLSIFEISSNLQGINNNPDKETCLLYTSPSPRDKRQSRMPSSA